MREVRSIPTSGSVRHCAEKDVLCGSAGKECYDLVFDVSKQHRNGGGRTLDKAMKWRNLDPAN
ncbi:hypothetical protein DW2_09899 [Thioclava atlantica]|uniref:Uncharacterized protein n=1 Tax=Thioclava atlantica TaxID=1317124 RepID=A0A085TVX2_9RHOB|nr:hypothetical protein DW2_09899 [Thioclava atlantica]